MLLMLAIGCAKMTTLEVLDEATLYPSTRPLPAAYWTGEIFSDRGCVADGASVARLLSLADREVVGTATGRDTSKGDFYRPGSGDYVAKTYDLTAPATAASARWKGWGTALKPAIEPAGGNPHPEDWAKANRAVVSEMHPPGRWPANIFACPKPSTSERNEGCDELPQEAKAQLAGAAGDGDDPVSRRFRTLPAGNVHPTVKPVRLMRWLVRLVTPPGGVMLEPFAGSGSTVVAVEREGFTCLAIEQEPKYCDIIAARVRHAVASRV